MLMGRRNLEQEVNHNVDGTEKSESRGEERCECDG